ncbi:Uncharacterized conserved protein YgbK, DUF1537 family [Faunimonas pinastri]|uniref:Uncharacterized conserved protein YgbK, DUF1537 family n=1 Tax=Faunimonas pinastri TaxID=1855383 RepID=A0A1H9B2J0_9HYPH|nr:Uncharacterized conserved protein YgbK, DUF1537 family [Faunimonas pinastri]
MPRIGWYGDDFTGATDTLATLAGSGLRTVLFLGVPDRRVLELAGPLDAAGIAGASRTMSPPRMAEELEPVGQFFEELGVSVLHYKCCSTFDSAPDVGSIGAAVATLRGHVANSFVPIVGGQPNIGRYCVFSNLFARAGSAGAVHRIDRHPTMSVHPVTPMREADLRLHLEAQGLAPVVGLHAPAYRTDQPEASLQALLGAQPGAVLMDLAEAQDLAAIGRLIWNEAKREPLLAVGPSSVAQALAAHWEALGTSPGLASSRELGPASGPVLLLAGSLSPVTRRQVEAARSYEHVALDAGRLAVEDAYATKVVDDLSRHLRDGRHVLAYTASEGPPSDTGRAGAIAAATARLVTEVLRITPLRRIGIAGGDTSSLAVKALPIWGLSTLTVLSPGVTVCRAHSENDLDGMELMLKGGQMGSDDLFERLLSGAPSA